MVIVVDVSVVLVVTVAVVAVLVVAVLVVVVVDAMHESQRTGQSRETMSDEMWFLHIPTW